MREEGKRERERANISKEHRMVSGDTNSFPQMLPKGNVRTKKQASMLCMATLAFFFSFLDQLMVRNMYNSTHSFVPPNFITHSIL